MTTADNYNDGDRVFVKMKGYPAWPALVKDRIPGKVEAYNVFFYGSYDSAKVKPDCMYPYNDETKAKFGKPQRKGGAKFKQAMDEIENNFEISEPEQQPALVPEVEVEPSVDEDVGALVIDETTVPPPVLKKEGKVTPASSGKKVPVKKEKEPKLPPLTTSEEAPPLAIEESAATPPPAKQPRRGSKAGKKDLSLVIPVTPEPSTPVTPAAEVVSRSGRKIKPKRFADDEVQFSTPTGAKPSPTTEEGKSLEPTPAKRPKRTNSVGSKTSTAPGTPTGEVKPETKALPPPPPLERPKLVAKRANQKKKTGTTTATVQAAAVVPPPSTRPPPPLRAMPTLIPAPSSPSVPQPLSSEPEVAKSELPVESEEKTKVEKPDTVDEEGKEDEGFSAVSSNKGDSSNPPTPGGDQDESKDAHETDDEGTEKENNLQEEEPSDNYENGIGEDSDEAHRSVPVRMRVDLKHGTASVILGFNHDRPTYFRNEAASVEYDMATARSVLQTKTQLEVNETAFLKTIADSLPLSKDEKEAQARAKAEQIQKKVAQLRMEGEMVEIIGELVGSLGLKFAFCDRALDLLDKLGSRTDINTLALKKNPEVVNVIRRVQNYHGNASQWLNLNQAQIDDFHVKAEMIREKAISIYQSFKLLFCTTAEKPFYETFNDELGKFNAAVAGAGISESAVIGLYDEPAPPPVSSEKPPSPALEESAASTPSTILGDTNGVAEIEAELCT